jgi:hypothetical protein
MDKELEMKLVEKYPDMLVDYGGDMRKTCMAWGFSHGNGWYKILEELCEKVKDCPGFKFEQVKEKFGMLTIYYTGPDNEKDQQLVSEAVREAEQKSSQICEVCGEKGKLYNDNGWLSTECKICKNLRQIKDNINN